MTFSWQDIDRPIIGLAPMADMTDSPFCRTVKQLASPIVWREMVSSEAVVRKNEKTLGMAAIHETERPLIQQIFGADPEVMAEAAKRILDLHQPDGIDINMGCPVYKITSNFNGAALMKEPKLAAKIVQRVKESVEVPVSIKMRAGWSDPEECIEFAHIIEDAGADLISIHGRTKTQAYTGQSNRDVVRRAKENVKIPVLYNGDIFEADDYFEALEETGCDGALIARGALGNPWIFQNIERLRKKQLITKLSMDERLRVIRSHLALHLQEYGEQSLPTFRKHLSWYFKGIPGIKPFRQKMVTAPDIESLEKVFKEVEHLDQP